MREENRKRKNNYIINIWVCEWHHFYLCLDIFFIGCVNEFRALNFHRWIEHISGALAGCWFKSCPIFRCISMTIVKFLICQFGNGIAQPWLIVLKLTIVSTEFTFGHFTSENWSLWILSHCKRITMVNNPCKAAPLWHLHLTFI